MREAEVHPKLDSVSHVRSNTVCRLCNLAALHKLDDALDPDTLQKEIKEFQDKISNNTTEFEQLKKLSVGYGDELDKILRKANRTWRNN